MTNASVKNTFAALFTLAVALCISLSVFAMTAHAQEDYSFDGGFDGGSDYSFDGSYSDYPTSDYSYDGSYSDYPSSNYSDYSNSDADCGCTNYSDYPASNYSEYPSSNYSDYPSSDADCGCTNYSDYPSSNYSDYPTSSYETDQGYNYSTGGSAATYHSTPMTIYPATYYSTPVSYRPTTPSYPTQPVYNTPSYVTNTNNTCTNNSCNSSYVDNSYTNNSINGSFNTTAPVYQATQQPIIQYVYPQTYTAPFCSISIGQGYQTGMISLSWSSTGATSAYITPNVGNVNVNGSTNIYAYGNTSYSLTVTGQGGTYTCRTQTYIAPQAPQTPYVSLSQIPYTGFDFGTFGNTLYWLALLSFAVAGAYLVVYYQGGALALAGSMFGSTRAVSYSETTVESTPVETVVAPEVHEAPAALFNLPTMTAVSTKDIMTVAHAADGVPRIIITRN